MLATGFKENLSLWQWPFPMKANMVWTFIPGKFHLQMAMVHQIMIVKNISWLIVANISLISHLEDRWRFVKIIISYPSTSLYPHHQTLLFCTFFSINIIDEQARNILLLFLFYVKMNIDTRMKTWWNKLLDTTALRPREVTLEFTVAPRKKICGHAHHFHYSLFSGIYNP